MRLVNGRTLSNGSADGLALTLLSREERGEDASHTITATLWALTLDDTVEVFGKIKRTLPYMSKESVGFVVPIYVGKAIEQGCTELLSMALESLRE